MTKLSKQDLKQRAEITALMRDKRENLNEAVEAYNLAMAAAWETLQASVVAYNESLSSGKEWVEGIASRMEDFMSDKSDNWQESDRANACSTFKDEYESADLEQVEPEKPEDLEWDFEDHSDLIENLPEEVQV